MASYDPTAHIGFTITPQKGTPRSPADSVQHRYEQCGRKINSKLFTSRKRQMVGGTKVRAVAEQYPDAVVLGADTIVYYDGAYLGKPKDAEDAERMLSMLSGQTHSVLTGVCIKDGERCETFLRKPKSLFGLLKKRKSALTSLRENRLIKPVHTEYKEKARFLSNR